LSEYYSKSNYNKQKNTKQNRSAALSFFINQISMQLNKKSIAIIMKIFRQNLL